MEKTGSRRLVLGSMLALSLAPSVAEAEPPVRVRVVNGDGKPVPVVVKSDFGGEARRQMVGLTEQTFEGDAGYSTFSEACAGEFSGSTMCTTAEVVRSPMDFFALTGGWVQPDLVPVGINSKDEAILMDRATGITSRDFTTTQKFTCTGFSLDSGTGLAVFDNGRFFFQPCNKAIAVACCAPQ